MRRCSLWMRRRRSRRSTARIRCCHGLRDAPSGTALSTSGKTAARHMSAEFVAFLADIVVNQPRRKEIHVIADNLSAHKTGQVDDFLDRHRKVHLHFTPTYSSWLNQIELWFAKDRARHHCPRRVHVVGRLAEKAHEVHPALQQGAKDRKVALLRSYASHHSQFSRYSPRDTPECGR